MVGDDGDDDDTDNDWWWWCSDNYGEIGDNFLQMQTAVVIGDGDYDGDDRQSYVAIKYFYIHFTRWEIF